MYFFISVYILCVKGLVTFGNLFDQRSKMIKKNPFLIFVACIPTFTSILILVRNFSYITSYRAIFAIRFTSLSSNAILDSLCNLIFIAIYKIVNIEINFL